MVKRKTKAGGRKNKMNKTRRNSMPNINITSPSQFKQLTSVLGKNPVVLVFVYADWCGHCQRFKPDWKKVSNTPARNMPMVSIRDDVFKESPLNNLVNPEGYPTISVVSAANNVSVNLPTREPNSLSKVVKNANVLAPAAAASNTMTTNVNNLLNNKTVSNAATNNMSSNNNNANNNTNSMNTMNNANSNSTNLLSNEYPLTSKKTGSIKMNKPVSRDTLEPPMSEEAYFESSNEEPATSEMNQLGGRRGLFEKLLRKGRAA